MASSPINDPKHWRQRAQELRALAAVLKGEAKETMLRTARDYDKLAERAALRADGQQPRLGGLTPSPGLKPRRLNW
jgi:hypothetical protein